MSTESGQPHTFIWNVTAVTKSSCQTN